MKIKKIHFVRVSYTLEIEAAGSTEALREATFQVQCGAADPRYAEMKVVGAKKLPVPVTVPEVVASEVPAAVADLASVDQVPV